MPDFYSDTPGEGLRFGDVVVGFPVATPAASEPKPSAAWTIAAEHPSHLVVLSPCCSIDKGVLLLAPLRQVRASFFLNPYLAEDLTRVNTRMPFDKSVTPQHLANMDPEVVAARQARGPTYASLDCFVYPPHPLLGPYLLNMKPAARTVEHHMVDFLGVFRMNCGLIDRKKPTPTGIKILELSIEARGQLRFKLADFFGRPPEEDLVA